MIPPERLTLECIANIGLEEQEIQAIEHYLDKFHLYQKAGHYASRNRQAGAIGIGIFGASYALAYLVGQESTTGTAESLARGFQEAIPYTARLCGLFLALAGTLRSTWFNLVEIGAQKEIAVIQDDSRYKSAIKKLDQLS